MAITENPYFQRFPSAIVPKSSHTPSFEGQRNSSPGSDVRIKRQSRPYWESDLSDCLLNEKHKDQLIAMIWRNGGSVRPVLNYIPIFGEIGTIVDYDWNNDPVVDPETCAAVVGVPNTYQLRKRLLVDGYENEQIYYEVKFPHIDYPAMYGLGRTIMGNEENPVIWHGPRELEIYSQNNFLPRAQWTANRDTGRIVTAAPAPISATGGFYILQLMPKKIPMTQAGNGLYKIDSGIMLSEPFGGR